MAKHQKQLNTLTQIVALMWVMAAQGCAFSSNALNVVSDSSSAAFDSAGEALDNFSYKKVKRASLTAVGLGPDEKIARAAFDEGDALFQQQKYKEAEKKYDKAAGRWPDSALEEDAMFMVAECQFFTDRYSASFDTANQLLKQYPNSRHIDTISKRLFLMGSYWQKVHRENPDWPTTPNVASSTEPWFDTGGHSLKAFQTIIETDSTGPLADDAIMQLANGYFLGGRYNDAADYYKMLRHQYPKSEHQFQAHLLGLQCELKRYQGPQYDAEPLDRAETLIDQLLTQFPAEVERERDRLVKQRQFVAVQKALRDWETASYYDRRGENLAARQYYRTVIERYPRTPIATDAGERLAELEGKPDREPRLATRIQTRLAGILPGDGPDANDVTDPFPTPRFGSDGASGIASSAGGSLGDLR